MKRLTYLRAAATLPLLVPLVTLPILQSVDPGGVLSVLAVSALVGGVPYAAVAGLSLYLLRGKPPTAYWRLARWAPAIFAPIFGVALAASGLDPTASLSNAFVLLFVTAVYVLPVGYGYVALAWFGYRSLERRRRFEGAA